MSAQPYTTTAATEAPAAGLTNGAAGTNGTATNGLTPEHAKKVSALDEKDIKRQEKEQAHAVKVAQSDEKAVRKAQKAEEKSLKVSLRARSKDWTCLRIELTFTRPPCHPFLVCSANKRRSKRTTKHPRT
jgi:hypothetical protein